MNSKKIYELLKEDTLKRYQERYYREGETPRALGWGCKEDQLERFKAICENVQLKGKTILDLGCGFADFYGYLLEQNIACQYIGVDVIPEFVDCCKEKYKDVTFICGDILLESNQIPKADVVITIGTLNKRLDAIDNLSYTKNFMKEAFSKAKELFIMDFLSSHLTEEYPKEDFVFYHDPVDVINMGFELTNDIKLIHNYRPIPQKEGMLIMYKEKGE